MFGQASRKWMPVRCMNVGHGVSHPSNPWAIRCAKNLFLQQVFLQIRNLFQKLVDPFACFKFSTGAAIDNTFFQCTFAYFTVRTMTNLHTAAFARSTVNHLRRKIKIVRLCPFVRCFFSERLVIVFVSQISTAFRTVDSAKSNCLFHNVFIRL